MLGEKLMKLRRRSGMSQQDVAAALSVSRQTISNWESGASAPDIGKAKELAALYRISLDDLVDDDVDVTVADGGEGEDDGPRGEVDLHVLKSLEGTKCRVALAPGFWMRGSSSAVDVLEVGTNWLRVAYNRVLKGRVTELVDMGTVVGFLIAPSPDTDKRMRQEEGEHHGCDRMD